MTTKEEAYKRIEQLVERFEEQYSSYKKSEYNETLTRRDFIDPFFKALGWDIDNEQGYAETYREVIHEDKIKVGKATKAPDYSFRLGGGKRLFFVEAKKPSVFIKDEILPAYQVRRYGWNAKLAVSVITDFEEFAIYDCTKKPLINDKAAVARIKYITYKDYLKEFDFIWNTFSKEHVLKGSFDKFVQSDTHKKGTATVDKAFLESLDSWRTYLATSIAKNNLNLDEDEINFAVQQTIDRFIFLRMAEDRGVEDYGNLQHAIKEGDYYKNLFSIFLDADKKYNSGLFDFKKDQISRNLKVDNKVIKTIVSELYYPISPYEFSVLSVEILGSAYEQFLGKVIRITAGHHAKIEEKPEVRKAGGVYYTPQYIVDYIVKNTVGKLTEGKTPKQIEPLKIVDPACGSGSFLLGAYQYLLDYHRQYYKPAFEKLSRQAADTKRTTKERNDAIKERNKLPVNPTGELTTRLKKDILLNNIYGVDIDVNAVEVTKLSLLLKCMEGETQSSITNEMNFGERVLPTLDSNIKSGNSLIDTDYYSSQFDFGEEKKIKPFNWKKAFPEVFKPVTKTKAHVFKPDMGIDDVQVLEEPVIVYNEKTEGGFDAVIGNPPYVRQELLGTQKDYFIQKYKVYHGMADLYSYFFERGIELLNPNGLFGIIVGNKFMRANYGEPLRKWLKKQNIKQIVDFGDLPVFANATTYPSIIICGKEKADKHINLTNVKTLKFENLENYVEENQTQITQKDLNDSGWNLASDNTQKLLKQIQSSGMPLVDYVKDKIYYGIKTGLNKAFVIDAETKERLIKENKNSASVIKPFLAGRDIKRYQTPASDKSLIFFPKGFTNAKGNKPKSGWKWLQETYPPIANYLKPFEEAGEKRFDQGDYWWELRTCEYYDEFEKPKILWPGISDIVTCFAFDENKYYGNDNNQLIVSSDKYLLGVLNSTVSKFQLTNICDKVQGGFYRMKIIYIKQLSIKEPKSKDELSIKSSIIKNVDLLLSLNQELQTTKLATQAEQLKARIDYAEEEINKAVYKLYDLTEEEIKIIEKNG